MNARAVCWSLSLVVLGCGSENADPVDGGPVTDAGPETTSAEGGALDGGEVSDGASDAVGSDGASDETDAAFPDAVAMPGSFRARALAHTRLASEDFSMDPEWLASDNHTPQPCVEVQQDFGYSPTNFADGDPGEIGGTLVRSVTPAYYGYRHPETDAFDGRLAVDGDIRYLPSNGEAYLGFFSSRGQGFRPANFVGIRFEGAGDHATVELSVTTGTYRSAGAFIPIVVPADDESHHFVLEFLPDENGGRGRIRFTLDGEVAHVDVDQDFRAEPLVIDRFGLMNVQKPGGSRFEVYLDDLYLNGPNASLAFDDDPDWDGSGNRASFTDCRQRDFQDYGYKSSAFAGGTSGEVGGLIWRVDGDDPPSFYATTVEDLTLDDYLLVTGRVSFQRGAVDSGLHLGFFHSGETFSDTERIASFFGLAIEGPSRIGHYFSAYVADHTGERFRPEESPVMLPDGRALSFALEYDPEAGEHGEITVELDGERQTVAMPSAMRVAGLHFDRFGITPWRPDGQSVEIYFDDLEYTVARSAP